MAVSRIVPDLHSASPDTARLFYEDVLGLEPVMNVGWIVTLADPQRDNVQRDLMTCDASAAVFLTLRFRSATSTPVMPPRRDQLRVPGRRPVLRAHPGSADRLPADIHHPRRRPGMGHDPEQPETTLTLENRCGDSNPARARPPGFT